MKQLIVMDQLWHLVRILKCHHCNSQWSLSIVAIVFPTLLPHTLLANVDVTSILWLIVVLVYVTNRVCDLVMSRRRYWPWPRMPAAAAQEERRMEQCIIGEVSIRRVATEDAWLLVAHAAITIVTTGSSLSQLSSSLTVILPPLTPIPKCQISSHIFRKCCAAYVEWGPKPAHTLGSM